MLARRLAEALGYPHVELDALHWAPNWVERPDDAFRELAVAATAGDRWILDGNYRPIRDAVWPRATAVIWLNYGFGTVFGRALARTWRRSISGETLFSGNRETLGRALFHRDSILRWVILTWAARRRRFGDLRASGRYPQLEWFELRTPAQAEALVADVARARAAGSPP